MNLAIKIINYIICILIVSIAFQSMAIALAKTSIKKTRSVTKKIDNDFLFIDQKILNVRKKERLNQIKEDLAKIQKEKIISEKDNKVSLVSLASNIDNEEKETVNIRSTDKSNEVDNKLFVIDNEIDSKIVYDDGDEEFNEGEINKFNNKKEINDKNQWTSIANESSKFIKTEFVSKTKKNKEKILNAAPEKESKKSNYISIKNNKSNYAVKRKEIISKKNVDINDEKEFIHIVKKGETLGAIARLYGIEISKLSKYNNISKKNNIYIGQKLKIKAKGGILYTIQKGDSLWKVAKKYGLSVSKLVSDNNIKILENLRIGQKIYISVNQKYYTRSNKYSSKFIWPVRGRISSRFGYRRHPITKKLSFHYGLDIAAKYGTPIVAARSGKVFYAGWLRGYGRILFLKHKDGYMTKYAHCSKLLVKKGQYVKQGQIVAKIGTSGRSTGPHVHFEVVHGSKRINPLHYLR